MLATIAYRCGKAIRGAHEGFESFRAEGTLNTPVLLLAHIGDLIGWAHRWCCGEEQSFRISEPLDWNGEVNRFYSSLGRFDQYLASGENLQTSVEAIFQAPISDALTHIGQLALLRRLAGDPVPGEAYRLAEIVVGRVGPEQAKPGREFEQNKGAIWSKQRAP
jgi:hypothetical protein